MKAIRYYQYGPPDVLRLEDADAPAVGDEDVLIRPRRRQLNPLDWHFMRVPPTSCACRPDCAFRRTAAWGSTWPGASRRSGRAGTGVRPGDEVFGACGLSGDGAFAEYARVPADRLAAKPANLTFEEAAAVPVSACTALQGLRDKGQVQAGQSVLITGAAGGVGSFAVQIAKAFGAEVTGVSTTIKLDLLRLLGADHVIDRTADDFTARGAST